MHTLTVLLQPKTSAASTACVGNGDTICTAIDNQKCCLPSANFYLNIAGTAVAHTTCGNQVDGAATRLTGESDTAAGTCATCAVSTYADTDAADCLANTLCGNLATGGSLQKCWQQHNLSK